MDVRSYDPAIARFTSIDPVIHYAMSTYTAFDNNPIFWADPSGADAIEQDDFSGRDQTTFSSVTITGGTDTHNVTFGSSGSETSNHVGVKTTTDKNGNKTININITGKLINFSDNKVDMEEALSQITNYIQTTFSGTFEKTTVITTANFSIAKSMKDVSESDHLIVLAELGGKNEGNIPGGSINFGAKVSFIDADYFTGWFDTSFGIQGERTTTHEIGHLFNLRHPSGGIMKQGGSNNDVSIAQINSIVKSFNNGMLNRGLNYDLNGLPNLGVLRNKGLFKMTNTKGRNKKVNSIDYFKKVLEQLKL